MTAWEKGIPGWVPQLLVTLSVLATVFLAGAGVGKFFELMTEAGGTVVAIIPISMVPWMTYKTIKVVTTGKGQLTTDLADPHG